MVSFNQLECFYGGSKPVGKVTESERAPNIFIPRDTEIITLTVGSPVRHRFFYRPLQLRMIEGVIAYDG